MGILTGYGRGESWRNEQIVYTFFSLVFLALSLACIGVSVYAVVVYRYLFDILNSASLNYLEPSAYIIIGGGLVLVLFIVMFYIGVLAKNGQIMFFSLLALCIPGIVLFTGGCFPLHTLNHMRFAEKDMEGQYEVLLKRQYSTNRWWTADWDQLQETKQCCAVRLNRADIYLVSSWYDAQREEEGGKVHVPESCCRKGPSGAYVQKDICQQRKTSSRYGPISKSRIINTRFTDGCYRHVREFTHGYIQEFTGLAWGTSISLFICIGLALIPAYNRFVPSLKLHHIVG